MTLPTIEQSFNMVERVSQSRPLAVAGLGPIMLVDFDGTAVTGHGPILAYAEEIWQVVPDRYVEGFGARLDEFLARLDGVGLALTEEEPADGYGMIRRLLAELPDPLTWNMINHAYLASRARLAQEDFGLTPTPGLVELLVDFPEGVEVILMTNAPIPGLLETLGRTGLMELFDQIVFYADKPRSWAHHLDILLGDGRPASSLISIGDNWPNDLEKPRQRGCATAHLSTRAPLPGRPVDITGMDFNAMAEPIRDWAERALSAHA